jgi:ubiquinone/menaquinone biosynthesis C-methylase UbiE
MGEDRDVTLFTEVDKTGDPNFFIRFLDHANALPSIQTSKLTILEGLHLREGLSVLDLGCGAGADVIDIAQRVGPSGSVIGVDVSQAMIAVAQERTNDLGFPIAFEVGDAMGLHFESNRFDACCRFQFIAATYYDLIAARLPI